MQNRAAQIQLIFVSLLAVAAWFRPLPRPRQLIVSALALIAISAIVLAQLSGRWLSPVAASILNDWLPVVVLMVPYWQIGCFFTKSDAQKEKWLTAFDRALFRSLGIQPFKASISPAISTYLELVYVMVYPLIPLGLAALYIAGLRHFVDYYWIVVLGSTYACFAMTPFVQAMPPRTLSDYEKFTMPTSKVAALNHFILRRASIQAITFPSAHVSSALAASLVLLRLDPWVGIVFMVMALSIALATVIGGYHYAADVLLAVLVAMLVFAGTFSMLTVA